MEIIDNINRLLGDELKASLTAGSKVRLAASTFSLYAYEALKAELESIGELQFIFTAPTFVAGEATDRLRKERREFYIPRGKRESSLYGSQFEIRLRNKLTQRAIARECAAWIKAKVTFKSNTTGAPMQQFAVVDEAAAYMPLHGFTSADLGYEKGDAVSNLVNKLDEAPMTTAYLQIFDQIWSSSQQVEDVTRLVHDHIASVYAENSPERIYFFILYNLFADFLEDLGPRVERVLMLSATPMDDDTDQLLNQLVVLGVADRVPGVQAADEGERLAALHTFLFRRLTKMRVGDQVLTRNRYRQEWRQGGTIDVEQPLPLEDLRDRLTFAVVQKKVAEALNNGGGGAQFQIGMLTSFESLAESTSHLVGSQR